LLFDDLAIQYPDVYCSCIEGCEVLLFSLTSDLTGELDSLLPKEKTVAEKKKTNNKTKVDFIFVPSNRCPQKSRMRTHLTLLKSY